MTKDAGEAMAELEAAGRRFDFVSLTLTLTLTLTLAVALTLTLTLTLTLSTLTALGEPRRRQGQPRRLRQQVS